MVVGGIIAAVFLCFALAFGAAFGAVVFGFNSMKSTAVYQHALTTATSNPEVINALGEPIEAGLLLTGSINVSDEAGDANLTIPISGPNGKGYVYLEAIRTTGDWDFHILEVEIEGSSGRINLMSETGR